MMSRIMASLALFGMVSAMATTNMNALQPQSQEAEVEGKFAMQSSFNVECKVDTLDVELDQPGEKVDDALEKHQIISHIGDIKTLEWAHISQHYFSDIDGRAEEKLMGTPGGDMGEFILAMAAFESQTGVTLDLPTTTGFLMEYVKSMSRVKFYMMTSEHAHDNLTASSGCRNLDISDPPEEKKQEILKKVVEPDNVGCKHLKYLLKGQYSGPVPQPRHVEMGIQAFHEVMWNKTFAGSEKLCYMLLKGPHKEKALLNVQTSQHCLDQNLAPLISPQTCFSTMFVNHPEAVTRFRSELAQHFSPSNARSLTETMNEMGINALAKTAAQVLKGYPVFSAKLTKSK